MHEPQKFEGALEFLNAFTHRQVGVYRENRFLASPFDADVWQFRFGDTCLGPINFGVRLYDGSLLTDPAHQALLATLKSWICVQDHPDVCGGKVNGAATAKHKIQRTLHLIDYLLLNGERLKLAEHGLACVTSNDLFLLLLSLRSIGGAVCGLYGRLPRLKKFLLELAEDTTAHDIAVAIDDNPALALPYEESEPHLGLSATELLSARVTLWKYGYYTDRRGAEGYAYMPELGRIFEVLYAQTLYGGERTRCPPELVLWSTESTSFREKPRAPVVTESDADLPGIQTFSAYTAILNSWRQLAAAGLVVSDRALSALTDGTVRQVVQTRTSGRYRTLPHEVVLSTLRRAIEFSLDYGEIIVQGYLEMLVAWKITKLKFLEFVRTPQFCDALSPELKRLGVVGWSLLPLPDGYQATLTRIEPIDYFRRFRSNHGLYELLSVLYGAVYFVVGTLMARRSGELDDLIALSCLDKSETRLIFDNRKSGEADLRQREARPLPKIGVGFVKLLQLIPRHLKERGIQFDSRLLFAAPTRQSGVPGKHAHSYRYLDLMCDYFETDTDEQGRRYYIRQHQLRRFFALLFFWGGAFGGLETLRWFLGHTDIEHLWHYITESVPGAVLTNVKAEFAVSEVMRQAPEANALADLIAEHFDTRDFAVLEAEELDQYVEELLVRGKVRVEPEFIDLGAEKSYRILILVTHAKGKPCD